MADAVTWNYVKDGPMVRPELEPELPTHMRKLHKWYLEVAKEGRKYLVAQVGKDHFLGKDEIHIEMEELFHLFNLYALDKSIVSCYTL